MTEQAYLPTAGMEPPRNPDVERAIDLWLEAKDEQRRAGDTTKIRHATLLQKLVDNELDAYPYVDAKTGKKKLVKVTREPKVKTARGERARRAKEKPERAKKSKAERDAEIVEVKRVPRGPEHDRAADPFGATRGLLEEAEASQTSEGDVAAPTSKRKAKKSAKGRRR